MGFDIAEETVRVLELGLEAVPSSLDRSQAAAFARWELGPYGAVFFIRRWRNDEFDTECAITCRGADGRWEYPSAYSGWRSPDPFDRPADGWDEEPVLWLGEVSSTVGDVHPPVLVRVVAGMASREVAALEVSGSDGLPDQVVRLRDDTGVFIVGMVGHGTHRVAVRSVDGGIARDRLGNDIRVEFEGEPDILAFLKTFSESAEDSLHFGEITNEAGEWSIEIDGVESKVIEPDLVEGLKKRLRHPEPWPRRLIPEEEY